MINKLLHGLVFLLLSTSLFAQVQSPSDFLPHELGEQFTPHHMLADYMQHVADNSPMVELTEYGRTRQKRPLLLAFIGTPENLARREAIRQNNLRRTGVLEGATDPALDDIAVIWLSFGVHGNEAAGPESAMNAIYQLLQHPDRDQWLENMLICYDPTINPDGYDRYTHWYRNVSNTIPDPAPSTREHDEPWPGGRVNHYLFDLNRDWAWQTQIESQQRMANYNQWLPQIHVDVHEQGYNSPYYFAPAAPPFHEYITDWQEDFQTTVGKNHAKYFDKEGWLFFTKERFDLLYPSYGDTYPTYNGAIGMTYEQGGIRGGRQITMENGDTLTLHDRIAHHTTTILSTIEVAAQHREQLIREFKQYWQKSSSTPPGAYKTFVISSDNPASKIKAFTKVLDGCGIEYGKAGKAGKLTAYDYVSGEETNLSVKASDLIISAYQPRAVMTQVLLEPETFVEDSITYDITAWSLPYAHGLQAYASKQRMAPQATYTFDRPAAVNATNAYAYLLPWEANADARFLSHALQKGLKARYAEAPFRCEGRDYPAGTIVFTRADNRKVDGFEASIQQLAKEQEQELIAVQTGFMETGSDFGSSTYRFIQTPKVLLLDGDKTSTNSFGQAWYYFEQVLQYPVTIRNANDLNRINLDDYNTLVLVDGRYRFSDSELSKLSSWVSSGGHLIGIGYGADAFGDANGFGLKQYTTENDKNAAQQARKERQMNTLLSDHAGGERRYISTIIPGAIFKTKVDNSHPLGFGLPDYYFSLKTSAMNYGYQTDAVNVATIGEQPVIKGFAGHEAQEKMQKTVVFAVEEKGRGSVTYLIDNPLYRGFWEQGLFVMSNAVFLVNN